MAHRIALASTDGKVINQHFGHADRFHIVDLAADDFTYVETRGSESCCNEFSHSTSSFDNVLSLLFDCEAIFVAQIGPGAAVYLREKGMRVFEAPYLIEDVLKQVIEKDLLGK